MPSEGLGPQECEPADELLTSHLVRLHRGVPCLGRQGHRVQPSGNTRVVEQVSQVLPDGVLLVTLPGVELEQPHERWEDLLEQYAGREPAEGKGWEMKEGSICGLGIAAPLPLTSAMTHFPAAFEKRSKP